jgi:hypothetical protein
MSTRCIIESKLWTELTDVQSEKVIGGVGRIQDGATGPFAIFGAGFYGWVGGPNHLGSFEEHKGLVQAGFTTPLNTADGDLNPYANGAVFVPAPAV